MNLNSCLCFIIKLSLSLVCFNPSQIHCLICILNENEASSPQVLNIFDIQSQSNSTSCRIKLTDISSGSSEYNNKLCFTESANDDNINFDSIEETTKSRTLIKVSGKFYPSSKESDSSPVNAVCMKGEIVLCSQSPKEDTFPDDLSLSKATKHRRKTLFDENNSDDDNSENEMDNEKSNDVHLQRSDQNHQEIIIVAPNEPDLSPNQDIKVEYVIGEELKLACLLESRRSKEVTWMKDNLTISSEPSTELVSDTEYQIFHNSINSFIILNVLKITINSANASGLYTCAIKSNSSTDQDESMSFQVIATSSREYAEYKFKRPNITGFIVGMIPSIMLFFYIIMSLGYRSRYAMEQEEEEEGLGI